MDYYISDGMNVKIIEGKDFNHYFRKSDGLSLTWGKTKDDDPEFSPVGPLIADIEIVKGCRGIRNKDGIRKVCPFCYKSNEPNDVDYMTFDNFKQILDKLPKSLGQIAFGVDAEANLNPDLEKILRYCREKYIIPNITIADTDDNTTKMLAELCGAIAVSYYPFQNKDICYNLIEKLTKKHGMKQVNIHCLVSAEMENSIYELIEDIKTDRRLKYLNAVVFLSLKTKGRGDAHKRLSDEKYNDLVETLIESSIPFGFDSCSAFRFLNAIKHLPHLYEEYKTFAEPCESTRMSLYINEKCEFYPCSFTEKTGNWEKGINLLEIDDFLKDVWYNKNVKNTRKQIISCNKCSKNCFYYEV